MSELANYKSEINETWSSTDMYHLHAFHLLITSSFPFTLSFIEKWHSCTNKWPTKSFLPLPFQERGNRKKNQKFYPNKKNGLLFNQVLMYKYYSKRFFTLFSYFLPRVFLFFLKNTWPPNGYFSNEKRRYLPSNKCFRNGSCWKGKAAMNTLHEGNLILLLSMPIAKILLLRNFLYLFSVVGTYISWMKYVRGSV